MHRCLMFFLVFTTYALRSASLPAIGVPTFNFDNNQHSPNENVRLGHFFDSIVTFAAILSL